MTKRGLITIIFVLIILNVFTLIYMGKKDREVGTPLNNIEEINESEENLTDKNVTSGDDYVATFKDRTITFKEWMRSLRETYGKEHLETMILEMVANHFSEEHGIEINEKVIEREVSFLTTMSGLMSNEELAEQKKQWIDELYYRYQLESLLTEDIHISEEEAQSHYNDYRNQYDFSASFQLSHILVKDLETAEKIIAELEEGAQFSLLAEEYSLDEDTKDFGGYLGYFTKGNQFIPHGYMDIINKLEEQSYSEPINLGNQYAIIYLHRDLPEITFTYEEVKNEIFLELAMKKIDRDQKIKELWNELGIEWIFDE